MKCSLFSSTYECIIFDISTKIDNICKRIFVFSKNMRKNMGKNISKNLSVKYRQKLFDLAKQSATNALKSA